MADSVVNDVALKRCLRFPILAAAATLLFVLLCCTVEIIQRCPPDTRIIASISVADTDAECTAVLVFDRATYIKIARFKIIGIAYHVQIIILVTIILNIYTQLNFVRVSFQALFPWKVYG